MYGVGCYCGDNNGVTLVQIEILVGPSDSRFLTGTDLTPPPPPPPAVSKTARPSVPMSWCSIYSGCPSTFIMEMMLEPLVFSEEFGPVYCTHHFLHRYQLFMQNRLNNS